MSRVQIVLSPEELLDAIRELSETEQRKLAGAVANDRTLEAFVEELEDILACERAKEEGRAEPFAPEELANR